MVKRTSALSKLVFMRVTWCIYGDLKTHTYPCTQNINPFLNIGLFLPYYYWDSPFPVLGANVFTYIVFCIEIPVHKWCEQRLSKKVYYKRGICKQARPGPGCSKLTTSLVNETLKFQMLISQICQYFLLKKCEKLLHCKSFSHFFNKKFQSIWL